MNFSLYRGNLHKVPDVPRRWPLSKPSMSLQAFKKALVKRQEALIREQQASDLSFPVVSGDAVATSSYPKDLTSSDPFPVEKAEPLCSEDRHEGSGETLSEKDGDFMDEDLDNGLTILADKRGNIDEAEKRDEEGSRTRDLSKRKREGFDPCGKESDEDGKETGSGRDRKNPRMGNEAEADRNLDARDRMSADEAEKCDEMDCDEEVNRPAKPFNSQEAVLLGEAEDANVNSRFCDDGGGKVRQGFNANSESTEETGTGRETERLEAPHTPAATDEEGAKPVERVILKPSDVGISGISTALDFKHDSYKAKRRAELEAKLQQLQETKHQLVQMLKQVLSNEEESKKRGQGLIQSSVAFGNLGAGLNDTLGNVVQLERKTGSELHSSTDLEEGELEYARTPSPPQLLPSNAHITGHASFGPSSSVASVFGRQPPNSQHTNQVWRQRGGRQGAR